MLKVPLSFLESPLEDLAYFLREFVDVFEDPTSFLKGCIEEINDPPEDSTCFPMHFIYVCLQDFIYFLNGSPMISPKGKLKGPLENSMYFPKE